MLSVNSSALHLIDREISNDPDFTIIVKLSSCQGETTDCHSNWHLIKFPLDLEQILSK